LKTIPEGMIAVEERDRVLAWLPPAFRLRYELLCDAGRKVFWENKGWYAVVSALSDEGRGPLRYYDAGSPMFRIEHEFGGVFDSHVVNGVGFFEGPLQLPMRQIFDEMWKEPRRSSILRMPGRSRPPQHSGEPVAESSGVLTLDEWRDYWRHGMWKNGIVGGERRSSWPPEWFLLEDDAGSDANLQRMAAAFRQRFWAAPVYAASAHYAAGYVGPNMTYLLDRERLRIEWIRFDQPFERNHDGLPVPPRWAIGAVETAERQRAEATGAR
jgi:hypothetical protein